MYCKKSSEGCCMRNSKKMIECPAPLGPTSNTPASHVSPCLEYPRAAAPPLLQADLFSLCFFHVHSPRQSAVSGHGTVASRFSFLKAVAVSSVLYSPGPSLHTLFQFFFVHSPQLNRSFAR